MSYNCAIDPDGTPSWFRVLRDAGYPTDVLLLDFETYFDAKYNLRAFGTIQYVQDPRFEVLGLGVLLRGIPGVLDCEFFERDNERIKDICGQDLDRFTVVGQNLAYDLTILSRRYGLYPAYAVDTLGLARHWNSRQKNGLEFLSKEYGLAEKGDTSNFKGLTLRERYLPGKKGGPQVRVPVATPEQMKALEGYCVNDCLRTWELFTILLPRLSNPKLELPLMQHTLEVFTKPVIRLNREMGKQLMRDMGNELNAAVEATGHTRKEISGNISFTGLLSAALEECGDVPARYHKPCKTGFKLADAKSDPERELLLNHPDAVVKRLAEARAAIKSWPLHIGRVESLVNQANADNGYLAIPLKYCGAHTQRWSGDGGINPQNLGAKSHPLINKVRETLIADRGQTLAIVDASQIEARVLAWAAGQDDLVEDFRQGEDIYCKFASKVLGFTVRKPRADDPEKIAGRLRWARNSIGKIGVLSSGFGAGADKLFIMADGQIDQETAERIKNTYHKENAKIVAFWYAVESAFKQVVLTGRRSNLPKGISFTRHEFADVIITLPNGAELKYHKARLNNADLEIFNGLKKSWKRTWGGALVENIVQSISRQILGEAILNAESAGYHVALHSHDEIVCPVATERALEVEIELEKIMSRVPVWAPGLPLAAEGKISEHYTK